MYFSLYKCNILLTSFFFFFFNEPAPTETYPLPLPDPLPITAGGDRAVRGRAGPDRGRLQHPRQGVRPPGRLCRQPPPPRCARRDRSRLDRDHPGRRRLSRSEEHTSELQSQSNIVCRLLLEKK